MSSPTLFQLFAFGRASPVTQGDLDAADLALKGMDTRTENREAIPVAETLVRQGGARYAQTQSDAPGVTV